MQHTNVEIQDESKEILDRFKMLYYNNVQGRYHLSYHKTLANQTNVETDIQQQLIFFVLVGLTSIHILI